MLDQFHCVRPQNFLQSTGTVRAKDHHFVAVLVTKGA